MNISITFDVEVWCKDWRNLDADFPAAFQRYVYGANAQGYALPKTLEILNRNRLKGVFFVEPLFSYRFGISRLKEIVDLITSAGHEVQLHLHPEWVDEANPPLVPDPPKKRPHLHQYSLSEQEILIAKGIEALEMCGVPRPTAFRAGNYACDANTFCALASNGIYVDSSVNVASRHSRIDGTFDLEHIQPKRIGEVLEYPVTVFRDGLGQPRHWQVGSAGCGESIAVIDAAYKSRYEHLVLVSHNFELLLPESTRPDRVVVSRFAKFCAWLSENSDRYTTAGLPDTDIYSSSPKRGLQVPLGRTASRLSAQIIRRIAAEIITRV